MLQSISDRELVSRLDQLRRHERETTLEILKHLNEVERRKLHLRLGHSSLFAYCTRALKYSESSAGRRIQAARCLRRFPQVSPLLERGEVNLMTLGLVATILTPKNADELIERIRGKTQREVESIACAYRPPISLRDRVEHVNVPSFTNSQCGSEQKLYIKFLADTAFMTKYRDACALLSNRLAVLSFESVLGAVLEEFIKRHSPAQREERRVERRTARAAFVDRSLRPAISRKLRDAVFVRDAGRCTYVGPGGQRCGERHHLHIDHIVPVAHGGGDELSNLRLLCAQHNQLEATRVLGTAVMSRYAGPV